MRKKFTTTLDENLVKAIKLYALEHNVSVNVLIERMIINLVTSVDGEIDIDFDNLT